MKCLHSTKAYVDVTVRFSKERKYPAPIAFVWEDGGQYAIDRALHVRRAVSLKVGGSGSRFYHTCKGKRNLSFSRKRSVLYGAKMK